MNILDHRVMFFEKKVLRRLRNRTPFFVFNKNALANNYKEYKDYLPPNTEICYSMKSNSEKDVLETLVGNGASFEISSKYELFLLKALQVPPGKIIYGASVKEESHIKEAANYGIDRFACDCEQELFKIAKYSPNARVYVRTLVDHKSDSIFHMSEKFGASLEDAIYLLQRIKELKLVPYGISFNVGSQARDSRAWARGLLEVASVMKDAFNNGIKIQAINIGGGFPYNYQQNETIPTISQFAKHINAAIKKVPYEVDYIAEPGRGLVANTYVLITSIIEKNRRANGHWLYMDAGVYNALLEALSCQGSIKYYIEGLNDFLLNKKEHFIVTGPTCDDLDVINRNVLLPSELQVGDRLIIYDVGAYSFPLITQFNGFLKPKVKVMK